MLDLRHEPPLTLAAATRLPELQRDGRKPHIATVHRWAKIGIHGVKLETAQLAGSRVTTRAAVGRFIERLTAVTDGSGPAMRTSTQRDHDVTRAEAELSNAGI